MKHLMQHMITAVIPFTKCSLIVQDIFSKIKQFFIYFFFLSQFKLHFLWDYFGQPSILQLDGTLSGPFLT